MEFATVDTSAQLRRALTSAAPGEIVKLYLPPGRTYELSGEELRVDSSRDVSLFSTGDGATIDAMGQSRAFLVRHAGSALRLRHIHIQRGIARNAVGGAILAEENSTIELTGCTIAHCASISWANNREACGGALFVSGYSNASLTDCVLHNATARTYGPDAMALGGTVLGRDHALVTMANVTISHGSVHSELNRAAGAAWVMEGFSTIVFTDSRITYANAWARLSALGGATAHYLHSVGVLTNVEILHTRTVAYAQTVKGGCISTVQRDARALRTRPSSHFGWMCVRAVLQAYSLTNLTNVLVVNSTIISAAANAFGAVSTANSPGSHINWENVTTIDTFVYTQTNLGSAYSAVLSLSGTTARLSNCNFSRASVFSPGTTYGAMINAKSTRLSQCHIVVINTTFSDSLAGSPTSPAYGGSVNLECGGLIRNDDDDSDDDDDDTDDDDTDSDDAAGQVICPHAITGTFVNTTFRNSRVTSQLGDAFGGVFNVAFGASLNLEASTVESASVYSNQSDAYGGVFRVADTSSLTVIGTTVLGSSVSTTLGNARGGVLQISSRSVASFDNCTFSNASATTAVAGQAQGGAIFGSADISLSNVRVYGCAASALRQGTGEGGGAYVAGGTLSMENGTLLEANRASHIGHAIQSTAGATSYLLPAPSGRWIAGLLCAVYREGCVRNNAGTVLQPECETTRESCGFETNASAIVSGYPCLPPLPYQPCDWQGMPSLLGRRMQALPHKPVDDDYPYSCASGLIGSAHEVHQMSSGCAGPAVAGTYQPTERGLASYECPAGHYCERGASTPTACSGGTYGNGTSLTSSSDCLPVEVGYWASTGSALPQECYSGFSCPGAANDRRYGGAQPVIIPVGSSATTVQRPILRRRLTLDTTIEELQSDDGALRGALAALYGVPAERIALEATAASLQVTVVITGGATDDEASMAAIATTVEALTDTTLGASLGMTVLASSPATTALEEAVVEFPCPRGHWCSAGTVTPCEPATYNPSLSIQTANGCLSCGLYTRGPRNATNITQCACAAGFVEAYDNGVDKSGGFTCLCPPGYEKRGDAAGNVACVMCESGSYKGDAREPLCFPCSQDNAVGPLGATSASQCGCPEGQYMRPDSTCAPCERGATCPAASIPSTIVLSPGRWRTEPNSTRIEACLSEAACPGGVGTSDHCPNGSTGALCAVCSGGYRRDTQGGCLPCEESDVQIADALPVAIVLLLLCPLLIGCCRQCMRRRRKARAAARQSEEGGASSEGEKEAANRAYRDSPKQASQRFMSSLIIKLKILTAHQQVLQGLAGVFRIRWPAAFKHLLAYLRVFQFDVISIAPIECIIPYDFLSALVVRTLVPLVLVILLVGTGQRALVFGYEALGYVLFNGGFLLTFLCYPSITQTVFRFFQRQSFDGNYGTYLIADYSVDTNGDAYKTMTPYAISMVCVWPFGVPLIIAILLWRSRAPLLEIRRRERLMAGVDAYNGQQWATHLSQRPGGGARDARDETELVVEGYLWSLTESYRGSAFYFEIIEYCLQKLTLVGLLVFYPPGTLEQLVLGLIVCFVYFGICCYLLPFCTVANNALVCVTQFSLFIAMLSAVIIEHGPADTPEAVVNILLVSAVAPAGLAILFAVQIGFDEMGIQPFACLCGCFRRRAAKESSMSKSSGQVDVQAVAVEWEADGP